MNWISVKDRLPEDGEWVIVTNGHDTTEAYIHPDFNWRNTYDYPITHWMHNPEPPKE